MKNKTVSEKIIYSIVFVIFLAYTLYVLIPLCYMLNGSLKLNGTEFYRDALSLSVPPNFDNYVRAFKELKINRVTYGEMLVNSVIFSTGSTFFGIMSSTFLAYAISKYDFRIKNFLYSLAIFVMIIPIYGSLPATFKLFANLNLTNSWAYLISTASAFGFNFIVIHSFFESISDEYAEAAFMDGAGHFTVFFNIMLPMAIPSITAIVITKFIGCWNDYMTPVLYLDRMPTLASGVWSFYSQCQYSSKMPIYFAGATISLLPIIVLYLLFQNTIMEKVYAGGLKG